MSCLGRASIATDPSPLTQTHCISLRTCARACTSMRGDSGLHPRVLEAGLPRSCTRLRKCMHSIAHADPDPANYPVMMVVQSQCIHLSLPQVRFGPSPRSATSLSSTTPASSAFTTDNDFDHTNNDFEHTGFIHLHDRLRPRAHRLHSPPRPTTTSTTPASAKFHRFISVSELSIDDITSMTSPPTDLSPKART